MSNLFKIYQVQFEKTFPDINVHRDTDLFATTEPESCPVISYCNDMITVKKECLMIDSKFRIHAEY